MTNATATELLANIGAGNAQTARAKPQRLRDIFDDLGQDVQATFDDFQRQRNQINDLREQAMDAREQNDALLVRIQALERQNSAATNRMQALEQQNIATNNRLNAAHEAYATLAKQCEQSYLKLAQDGIMLIPMLDDLHRHAVVIDRGLQMTNTWVLTALMVGYLILAKAPAHIQEVCAALVLAICAIRAVMGIWRWYL